MMKNKFKENKRIVSIVRMGVVMTLLFCFCTALFAVPLKKKLPEVNEKTFGPLSRKILPSQKEKRWKKIGWREDLKKGLKEAKAMNRPILLWAMNGQPLGNV